MRAIESGGVRAEWDEERGLLRLHMRPGCVPTAEDADRIADALEAWSGIERPVRALVDCEGATGLYVGWRVRWTKRIKRHPRAVRMAYCRVNGMASWIMPYFVMLTGVEARPFDDEADARVWLVAWDAPRVAPLAASADG